MNGIHLSQLMNLEIHFKDADGRPLAESKLPPHLREGIAYEHVECPYTGSRYRHIKKMNVSALKQMKDHWETVLDGFRWLRAICQRHEGQATVHDFLRITGAAYMLPSFLFYRAQDPVGEQALPGAASALYKAALGMVTTGQLLIIKGIVTGGWDADTMMSADEIVEFVEREGLFIGETEVCAGPHQMVVESLSAITEAPALPPACIDWMPDAEKFARYVVCAEKVALFDFLFPLFYYFFTPVGAIARLFETVNNYRAGRGENIFLGEISMELQLLDIIAPVLDAMSEGERNRIVNTLTDLFNTIDSSGDVIELVRHTHVHAHEKDEILKMLKSSGAVITETLSADGLDLAVSALVTYLALERTKLKLFVRAQAEMNQLLGRAAPERAVDSLDITRMYNRKLRDLIAELLVVEIDNQVEQTIVRQGVDHCRLGFCDH